MSLEADQIFPTKTDQLHPVDQIRFYLKLYVCNSYLFGPEDQPEIRN